MRFLVKTTGPFVIPLGRGEFALPEECEVEDSAALRDEILRGRVVIVEEKKDNQPEMEKKEEEIEEISYPELDAEEAKEERAPAKRQRRS